METLYTVFQKNKIFENLQTAVHCGVQNDFDQGFFIRNLRQNSEFLLFIFFIYEI